MFENIINFFTKMIKKDEKSQGTNSKEAAKERLHLVLMQDRANVSVDFLELMKQEIIDVIKKYIEVDEKEIDVRLTNKENEDGTNGAPALYANIPILNIKNDARKIENKQTEGNKTVKEEKLDKKDTVTKELDKKEDEKPEVKEEKENKEINKETDKEINKESDSNNETINKKHIDKDKKEEKSNNEQKTENK